MHCFDGGVPSFTLNGPRTRRPTSHEAGIQYRRPAFGESDELRGARPVRSAMMTLRDHNAGLPTRVLELDLLTLFNLLSSSCLARAQ